MYSETIVQQAEEYRKTIKISSSQLVRTSGELIIIAAGVQEIKSSPKDKEKNKSSAKVKENKNV